MVSPSVSPNHASHECNLLRTLAEEMEVGINNATNPDPDFIRGFLDAIFYFRFAAANSLLRGNPIEVAISILGEKIQSASSDPLSPVDYEYGLSTALELVCSLDHGTSLKPRVRQL